MSVLRKIGKGVAGFLFTLSLISALVLFSVVQLTQFDSIKGFTTQILSQQSSPIPVFNDQQKQQFIDGLQGECQNKQTLQFPIGSENVTFDCSQISSVTTQNIASYFSTNVVSDLYNKQYTCDFLTCLRTENPFPLLITDFAHKFYEQMFNYAVIAAIVLAALFVLACENLNDRLKSMGFSLLWTSVPFIAASYAMDKIVAAFVPANVLSLVGPVLSSLFAPTFMIYVYILVAGIALVAAGYLIKPGTFARGKKK